MRQRKSFALIEGELFNAEIDRFRCFTNKNLQKRNTSPHKKQKESRGGLCSKGSFGPNTRVCKRGMSGASWYGMGFDIFAYILYMVQS